MPSTDPIAEQIAADVLRVVSGITTPPYTFKPLAPQRAVTATDNIDPADLKTIVSTYTLKPRWTAPYGIEERAMVVQAGVYLREGTTALPMDRRAQLVLADLEQALMADRRRSGLCYLDNIVADRIVDDGVRGEVATGIWSVHVLLLCEFRTLVGQPAVLAPGAGNEGYFQGGCALLVAEHLGERVLGPWHFFGNLQVLPIIEPEIDVINDDRNGALRELEEESVGFRLKYEIGGDYLNPQLLAWYYGGGAAELVTQSGSPLVNVTHVVAGVDSVLPLHDAANNPVFGIASVQSIAAGAVTYVAGVDYIVDAEAMASGMIKLPATSSIAAGVVSVSFTPTASASRPAFEVAAVCRRNVAARLIWSDSTGAASRVHGDFKGSIVPVSMTDPETKLSTIKLHLTVLDDGTSTPNSRIILPAGALPTAGY